MQNEIALDTRSLCVKRSLSNSSYHADKDVLSSTMLKSALVSPAHYIAALTQPHACSPQKLFGTLLHTLVLEPEKVDQVVALYPGRLGKDSASREFRKANGGRLCMDLADYFAAMTMANKVREATFRGRPFYRFIEEGEVEASFYYDDPTTGIACRTRLDLFHPEFTFDLKTTRHCSPSQFQRDAVAMHYDLSVYMYSLSRVLYEKDANTKPFILVPVDSAEPHGIHFMPCSSDFLRNGQRKYSTALSTIKASTDTDHWPALDGECEMDILPWQVFTPERASWRPSTDFAN